VEASKQFSFRLPETLVERVEHCAHEMRERGLDVTRADVVRLLLNHALDATQCKMNLLLRRQSGKRSLHRERP
jgi:hypothetical protein